MQIKISDTTTSGEILNEISIAITNERTTLREIISSRVQAEVDRHNAKNDEYFHGLVQPSESEKTLNGFKLKGKKIIDGEKQTYIALDAFKKNAFFVLVDDLQETDLDKELLVNEATPIHFLKLTPLVGG